MGPAVHILATVRKAELIEAALLIFRTLRVGFPTAPVHVWGNGLDARSEVVVGQAARGVGAQFMNLAPTVHDAWIEELIQESMEPFWILDTDVCLWESVEQWAVAGEACLVGRLEPAFEEESTGTLHVERLHTALMWFNPGPLRAAMRQVMARIPAPWGHKGNFPLIKQQFIPVRSRKTLFYDTCAGLWQAGIGTAFTEAQDRGFDHLHCGTYVDMIGPALSTNLAATHQAIYRDISLAKGMLEHQKKYYARLAPRDGSGVLTPRRQDAKKTKGVS